VIGIVGRAVDRRPDENVATCRRASSTHQGSALRLET